MADKQGEYNHASISARLDCLRLVCQPCVDVKMWAPLADELYAWLVTGKRKAQKRVRK